MKGEEKKRKIFSSSSTGITSLRIPFTLHTTHTQHKCPHNSKSLHSTVFSIFVCQLKKNCELPRAVQTAIIKPNHGQIQLATLLDTIPQETFDSI